MAEKSQGVFMTQRIAQLDLDRLPALNREVVPEFVSPPVSETSFLGLLRQRFSSDEDLAEQLQSGNADALTVLFHRHSGLLFGIAKRILRNEAEAEDAVQQIFLDAYRAIQQFDREKGSFKTWLLMFTYHRTFNSRRSQTASRFFDTDPLDENLSSGNAFESDPRRRTATENSVLVAQVLKSLQPRQRRTIELIYYDGLTAEEVSTHTGESVRVVRHNLYRGLEKLRKLFCEPTRPVNGPKGEPR